VLLHSTSYISMLKWFRFVASLFNWRFTAYIYFSEVGAAMKKLRKDSILDWKLAKEVMFLREFQLSTNMQ